MYLFRYQTEWDADDQREPTKCNLNNNKKKIQSREPAKRNDKTMNTTKNENKKKVHCARSMLYIYIYNFYDVHCPMHIVYRWFWIHGWTALSLITLHDTDTWFAICVYMHCVLALIILSCVHRFFFRRRRRRHPVCVGECVRDDRSLQQFFSRYTFSLNVWRYTMDNVWCSVVANNNYILAVLCFWLHIAILSFPFFFYLFPFRLCDAVAIVRAVCKTVKTWTHTWFKAFSFIFCFFVVFFFCWIFVSFYLFTF